MIDFTIPGALDAANDVDSADYTGFSLLGEDLLGGLFGSSGSKKPSKNKNKQVPFTSTTTTRRPRPTRRPVVRPARTTTRRPVVTRTTTIRVRPVNRRTTRRPLRRRTTTTTTTTTTTSTERPTSVSTVIDDESAIVSKISTTMAPLTSANTEVKVPLMEMQASVQSETHQVIPITEKFVPVPELTTRKTTFEDAGLEMSLAHITDQLSLSMPVTQLSPTDEVKETNVQPATEQTEMNYEKVETITSKPHSKIPFATTVDDDENEEMVQIVESLDSHSEEHAADSENVVEETRGHHDSNPHYEGLSLPKKKHRGGVFNLDDLDVLDLTGIGESVGRQLGIFGRHKRQNKNKAVKPHHVKGVNDYDDVLGLEALSEAFPDIDDLSRKDRRRENKMMKGLWP